LSCWLNRLPISDKTFLAQNSINFFPLSHFLSLSFSLFSASLKAYFNRILMRTWYRIQSCRFRPSSVRKDTATIKETSF
jgi:hypothetical protein